jgi:hypothetical protein
MARSKTPMKYKKNCAYCNCTFFSHRESAKFCSNSHRTLFSKKRRQEIPPFLTDKNNSSGVNFGGRAYGQLEHLERTVHNLYKEWQENLNELKTWLIDKNQAQIRKTYYPEMERQLNELATHIQQTGFSTAEQYREWVKNALKVT